eukprot:Em0017g904a
MTNRKRKSSRGKEPFRGPFIVQPPVPCFTLFRPRVVVEVTFRGTETAAIKPLLDRRDTCKDIGFLTEVVYSSTEYLRACMGTDLQGDWAEIRIYAENSYVLTDRVIRRGSHDLVTKLAASEVAEIRVTKRKAKRGEQAEFVVHVDEQLNDDGFNIHRGGVYHRLIPKRSSSLEGKRHVTTVPVKLIRAQNDSHAKHVDQTFCVSTASTYKKYGA